MYCRNCGKEITAGAGSCPNCGVSTGSGKSYCPNCGYQTGELAVTCARCGFKLSSSGYQGSAELSPGVISPYKHGWNRLWPSFLMLFLAWLIYVVITGAVGGILQLVPYISFLSIFVSIPLGYGLSFCFLRAARNEEVRFEELFEGFRCYWNSLGAGVLSTLIILGGFILLIVPGIIFACKLAFVPYLVIDRKMGPTEAISTSWKMTSGHAMEVFLIYLLGIPIMIAGLICLGVGVIISIMWISMANASLYYAVSKSREQVIQSPEIL
ncbi:MAG: hypothetical protein JXA46_19090 [Dehalococcoidales bacterium]|nr:hypothetical protein [Dehalococcoidales bacterium]